MPPYQLNCSPALPPTVPLEKAMPIVPVSRPPCRQFRSGRFRSERRTTMPSQRGGPADSGGGPLSLTNGIFRGGIAAGWLRTIADFISLS